MKSGKLSNFCAFILELAFSHCYSMINFLKVVQFGGRDVPTAKRGHVEGSSNQRAEHVRQ